MANPTAYTRYVDYSDFQSANPDTELNGASLDVEFDRIKTTTDETIAALGEIRRSDGNLANGIVGVDSFTEDAIALMGEWEPRGDWVTATAYVAKDVVREGGANYVCLVAHTSGTFATDLSAAKWMLLGGTNVAADVSFTPAGTIAATDVQAAIEEVSGDVTTLTATVAGKQASDATLTALAGVATAADKMIYATASDVFAVADLTAFARTLLDDANAAAARATLGAAALVAENSFSGSYQLMQWTDAGATGGPPFYIYRDTATPAAADVFGRLSLSGPDSGQNFTEYATMELVCADPADGSEDGHVLHKTMNAGVLAERLRVGQGLLVGPSATSGDMGAGTINVDGDYYRDGARLQTARAWLVVDFNNGGTLVPAIEDSFNVTSISDNGVGDTTVTMTNAMTNATYAVCGMGVYTGGVSYTVSLNAATARSTTVFRVIVIAPGSGAAADVDNVSLAVFGD